MCNRSRERNREWTRMDANKRELILRKAVFEVAGCAMEVPNELMKMFFCNLFDNITVIRVY